MIIVLSQNAARMSEEYIIGRQKEKAHETLYRLSDEYSLFYLFHQSSLNFDHYYFPIGKRKCQPAHS